MLECHSIATPMNKGTKLQTYMNFELVDITFYQQFVWSFIFLTHI
jgi:hypothetical protein